MTNYKQGYKAGYEAGVAAVKQAMRDRIDNAAKRPAKLQDTRWMKFGALQSLQLAMSDVESLKVPETIDEPVSDTGHGNDGAGSA